MKKIFKILLVLTLGTMVSFADAKEPCNLFIAKKELIRYHDSGEYNRDIQVVVAKARHYLRANLASSLKIRKKKAIVLDIDETALSNYSHMVEVGFGGSHAEIKRLENQGDDPAIAATLALYQYAKSHQLALFFITGRTPSERESTIRNLKAAGYDHWDGLIFKPLHYGHEKSPAYFKTAARQKITQQGYEIVLNMGDQISDLSGGFAEKAFKLPNPYYFIP